jgi:kinetochore-associated protein 1
VGVDRSLILLEDESTFDCRFLSFSSEIQAMAVSRSGDLVVCCLADGNIHGVHIKGIPVFNM